tara:strand:+ start:745 stop:1416 length:672 start_codon:yes stop_codon:yes gene_type:complete
MNVISYFQPIPNSSFSEQSKELLPMWKQTWENNGWNPIILNETTAIQSKIYKSLDFNNPNANFYSKNPISSFEYNRSCYLRLLAYCEYVKQNGETLYSDFDVMNYGLGINILKEVVTNSLFCIQRSVVYLDKEGALDIERVLIECNAATELEWCHRNDMRLMEYKTKLFTPLVNNGEYIYCCSSYTERDKITPLVHYNGGCYLRGAPKNLTRAEIILQHGRIK